MNFRLSNSIPIVVASVLSSAVAGRIFGPVFRVPMSTFDLIIIVLAHAVPPSLSTFKIILANVTTGTTYSVGFLSGSWKRAVFWHHESLDRAFD